MPRKENHKILSCKGICKRYKSPRKFKTGWYASGHKRCQMCEVYMKVDGLWCPCCGYRLRLKPRARFYKEKLKERLSVA